MQAAPRDALISDLAPEASRSACFGFAQSIRKWGSFLGAGMCYFLMKVNRAIFLFFIIAIMNKPAVIRAFPQATSLLCKGQLQRSGIAHILQSFTKIF